MSLNPISSQINVLVIFFFCVPGTLSLCDFGVVRLCERCVNDASSRSRPRRPHTQFTGRRRVHIRAQRAGAGQVAAKPAPPNSLHAYCGQRALCSWTPLYLGRKRANSLFGSTTIPYTCTRTKHMHDSTRAPILSSQQNAAAALILRFF